MSTVRASFFRDQNRVPLTVDGIITTDTQTLVGSNATVAVPIYTVSGSIEVRGLWGVVTTVLGANNTAAYWRFNDGTAQSNITVNTGTTLSAAGADSIIVKKGLAAAALTLLTSDQERVSEPTTLETPFFSPFVLTAKTTVTSNVEFVYSTTDTPTSGVIQFFIRWLPLSNGANVTAL